jgi:SWI/SNF-related matrix-associated actin-dependent regulator of chromatin subfamily A3
VTGTPLQNRIADVYGLLVFLGLNPLDDKAFWRRCVERPLRQRDSRALLTLKVRTCLCFAAAAARVASQMLLT